MQSVAAAHPDWERYVLLVDRVNGYFQPEQETFRLISINDLSLPEIQKFLFRYTVLELNTAVKPWFLEWLFAHTQCAHVVYLDPDIYVYRPLVEVQRLLDQGAFMVLTPHLTRELDDGWRPHERDILLAGAYNLGFLGLARHGELPRFLTWWQRRLEFDCRVDHVAGLFVDQRWMDLAPGLFADVAILRHPGYNVAYWNLNHRPVRLDNSGPWVGQDPLRFFHFSGLDPTAPASLSRHQDRFLLKNLGQASKLVEAYSRKVLCNGWVAQRRWPYAFGFLKDGTPIPDSMRRLYRSRPQIQERLGANPFADSHEHLNTKWGSSRLPLVTCLMRHLWESSGDLQAVFPDIDGAYREPFANHFVETLAAQASVPERFVFPVRAALREWTNSHEYRPAPRLRLYDSATEDESWHPLSVLIRMLARLALTVLPLPRSREGLLRLYHFLRPLGWLLPALVRSELKRDLRRWLYRRNAFRRSWSLARVLASAGRGLRRLLAMLWPGAARSDTEARRGTACRSLRTKVRAEEPVAYRQAARVEVAAEGMNIVGYLSAETGVGESARLCAQAATATGLPFSLHDFQRGYRARSADRRWVPLRSDQNNYSVNLFHINADQLAVARETLGEDFFASGYNIGYWHWELPEFPERWLAAFDLVDEVWVPSRFVHDAIAARSPRPVVRIPHGISFAVDEHVQRGDFGLPAKDFLFLVIYDIESFQARKNPEGAIEAFRRAFAGSDHVSLVIKVNNVKSNRASIQRLRALVAGMPNVVLLDRVMSRQEVYNLEGLCDCFVSLHRAEGFGLGLAECMFLGKPVIATGWSGNCDFLTPTNSCPVQYRLVRLERDIGPYEQGQFWAEPDLDHAANLMKKVVADPDWRQIIAAAGQATIRSDYSPQRIGRLYRQRLAAIRQRIVGCMPSTVRAAA
jgi:glycosyltransferase involved in cell wall biosynthesis